MADGLAERVMRYRNIAEELRTLATDWIDADAIAAITRLADDYDRRAKATETEARAPSSPTTAMLKAG